MSFLRPEQRVNKLGHVVTKHVRADEPDAHNKADHVPPPSLGSKIGKFFGMGDDEPKESEKPDVVDRNARELVAAYIGNQPQEMQNMMGKTFSKKFDGETLQAMNDRQKTFTDRENEMFGAGFAAMTQMAIETKSSVEEASFGARALLESTNVFAGFAGDLSSEGDLFIAASSRANMQAFANGHSVKKGWTDDTIKAIQWFAFENIVKYDKIMRDGDEEAMKKMTNPLTALKPIRDKEALRDNMEWFSQNSAALEPHADAIRRHGSTDRAFLESLL